jgi:hypothetical protein
LAACFFVAGIHATICCCCVLGLVLRTIITFFIMGRRRYTWKEQLFYAVAWTPKATVQASLSAVPLSLINRTMVNDPNYEQWVQWGSDLLATGIFAIIICATLGTAMVFWLAPVLLEKSVSAVCCSLFQVLIVSTAAARCLSQPCCRTCSLLLYLPAVCCKQLAQLLSSS